MTRSGFPFSYAQHVPAVAVSPGARGEPNGCQGFRSKRRLASDVIRQALALEGAPLEPSLRGEMESLFGYDFSDVRIHTDPLSARSAQLVGAKAYTVGSDVAFAPGQYQPHTPAGRHLLAHELAHVVQQHRCEEFAAHQADEFRISESPDLEAAADAAARRVAAGLPAPTLAPAPASSRGMLFRAKHTTRFNLWDPQEVWAGSGNTPDTSFIVAVVVAELDIPNAGVGTMSLKTLVTTTGASRRVPTAPPGGATQGFFGPASPVRFGVSDGTHTGSDAQATRVGSGQTEMEYVTTSNFQNATNFELYVYVKMLLGGRTLPFVEVKFNPQLVVEYIGAAGHPLKLVDKSPNPVVRYDPYGRLRASRQP